MAVLSILYPAGPAVDLEYYRAHHIPLVKRLFGPLGLRCLTYYRPIDTSAYQLVAQLRFDTMEQLLFAREQCGSEARSDISKFASVVPITLVGEEISESP